LRWSLNKAFNKKSYKEMEKKPEKEEKMEKKPEKEEKKEQKPPTVFFC